MASHFIGSYNAFTDDDGGEVNLWGLTGIRFGGHEKKANIYGSIMFGAAWLIPTGAASDDDYGGLHLGGGGGIGFTIKEIIDIGARINHNFKVNDTYLHVFVGLRLE